MSWSLIIIGVLSILAALKFIKTIGKVIFLAILVVSIFVICIGGFGVNPIDYIRGLVG